jgi:uncharacterized membrane protein YcfT
MTNSHSVNASTQSRIDWVDYAKGLCIILVVMMHTTLGVEKAAGELSWLHGFIDWAKPFRMPDFFLISGLFLAARIDKPWRTYADSKILHFIYFYVLWMSIQMLTKAYGIYQDTGLASVATGYLMGFVQPFGTLWFIYMLAIFFAITKAIRSVPPLVVFVLAAALEIAPIDTGWVIVDEFAARYVYFFAGYWLAQSIFAFANRVNALPTMAIFVGLVVWGLANHVFVVTGLAEWPGISLVLGFIGAGAVVSAGVLLSKIPAAAAIRYCGQNSIVIYLSFFIFMAAGRAVLLKFAPSLDLGVVSLVVTALGIAGAILLFWTTRHTPLAFLWQRPDWARAGARGSAQAARPMSNLGNSSAQ